LGYNIEWDGNTVTFSSVGHSKGAVSVTSSDEGALRLIRRAISMLNSAVIRPKRISVPVVLIPRPNEAVLVPSPQSVGGDKDAPVPVRETTQPEHPAPRELATQRRNIHRNVGDAR
jgi:hypothetical protein